ncbi:hypothetical protein CCAX7_26760 [Capsulimonas corticalis]|uniref:Uncharacterized protein n=1 Tax=Capsulimonas corticalis TaxID=2219043 RepID=A0A402CTU0_9BACT|nr:DUF4132 domain-containing protein [Capsulimonas corticalis]BDI30625.1 hypothetical protein CCAX7_26760 [Capsulimonas corticalis]
MTTMPHDDVLRAERLIDAHLRQTSPVNFWDVKPNDSDAGREILSLAPKAQIPCVHILMLRGRDYTKEFHDTVRLSRFLTQMLSRSLPYTAEDLVQLLRAAGTGLQAVQTGNLAPILRSVERFMKSEPLNDALKETLTDLHQSLVNNNMEAAKIKSQVGKILGISGATLPDPGEAWADAARTLALLEDDKSQAWSALFSHALTATGSKPTAKWLAELEKALKPLGAEDARMEIIAWLNLAGPTPPARLVPQSPTDIQAESEGPNGFLLQAQPTLGEGLFFRSDEKNITLLKGCAWMLAESDSREAARGLGHLAEAGFRSIPGSGPWAPRAGNAAIWALGQMPEGLGVPALTRLRTRLRDRNALKLIASSIESAAAKAGLTVDELEDISVPTGGLDASGVRHDAFGEEGAATLTLDAATGRTTLAWFGADGKPRKAVPAGAKREFAAEVKALKLAEEEVRQAIGAQAARLDRALTDERSWTLAAWRERCLTHPVLGGVVRRLIWTFDGVPASIDGDTLTDIDLKPLPELPAETVVRLWSPIESPTQDALRWRELLSERGIVQPFKQAHREIYLLTDAERATNTYSNRFAAHVLKQHQFNTLCVLRGWKNSLRLMVDDCYPPATKQIPKHNLRAEFWVEGIGDDYGVDTNETGTYLRLVTDQVRFYHLAAPDNLAHAGGGGYGMGWRAAAPLEALPLDQIPTHVLSEVMRDVDLFVGVSSLGNDPAWADGGPGGRFRNYWQDYAFGDLGATAATRKEILARLLPRLKIAGKCTLDGKFLTVQGALRAYKIHLGSGNILMEPNDQYLCIVPGRGAGAPEATQGLFLPFEGDQMLSIILSKAFLLADDAKITDPTITRQIS